MHIIEAMLPAAISIPGVREYFSRAEIREHDGKIYLCLPLPEDRVEEVRSVLTQLFSESN